MSRIGIKPVVLTDNVKVNQNNQVVIVEGDKGRLEVTVPTGILIKSDQSRILVERSSEDKEKRSLHGTIRSLIQNAVTGVTKGFTKNLELVGIGYRAAIEGEMLVLQVGYTHPVKMIIPDNLQVKVEKNIISINGIDKQAVGQFAAIVRDVRRPEPYKGKGIRYQGELVRMKQGKAAKSGA